MFQDNRTLCYRRHLGVPVLQGGKTLKRFQSVRWASMCVIYGYVFLWLDTLKSFDSNPWTSYRDGLEALRSYMEGCVQMFKGIYEENIHWDKKLIPYALGDESNKKLRLSLTAGLKLNQCKSKGMIADLPLSGENKCWKNWSFSWCLYILLQRHNMTLLLVVHFLQCDKSLSKWIRFSASLG